MWKEYACLHIFAVLLQGGSRGLGAVQGQSRRQLVSVLTAGPGTMSHHNQYISSSMHEPVTQGCSFCECYPDHSTHSFGLLQDCPLDAEWGSQKISNPEGLKPA